MVRKLTMIGIALIGFTLAMGSNAWADRDRGDRGHRNDKGYHHNYKTPKGHHYGWDKGKGNPHRDRYEHRREYRHRDRYDRWGRDHRWDRDRHHRDRDRDHRYKGHHHRKRVVEKHVYHHAPKHRRHHDEHFNIAVSIIDQAFGVAVAVGGRR